MNVLTHQTRPGSQILSFAGYQPDRVVTNDELAAVLDTDDEWIRSRVGIQERRIAGPSEDVLDLAVEAGRRALAGSGLAADQIDLVIVATCSAESPMPGQAPRVASRLGITSPGAFDINAACAGFCYSLGIADGLVRSGAATNVLVIGAEKMSQWTDAHDRTTAIIFADGAGAAVVSGADAPAIGPTAWGSAGDLADKLVIATRHSSIVQDGQAVFRWATQAVAPVALEACRRAGVDPADLVLVAPHQANLRIIRSIAKAIGASQALVAEDIVRSGNTSAASVPLAVSRMMEQHPFPSGAPALLVGFGAGLAFAAQVVLLP
nr:beta-ketoacyl-ACP synthase III [Nocardioides sp. Iso805N]